MNLDLRTWSKNDLTKLLNFTEIAAEQSEQLGFDNPDLEQAREQARAYIERRKKGYRNLENPEDADVRNQVRTFLKRKGIIKD